MVLIWKGGEPGRADGSGEPGPKGVAPRAGGRRTSSVRELYASAGRMVSAMPGPSAAAGPSLAS